MQYGARHRCCDDRRAGLARKWFQQGKVLIRKTSNAAGHKQEQIPRHGRWRRRSATN